MLWEVLFALAGAWLVVTLGGVFHLFWRGQARRTRRRDGHVCWNGQAQRGGRKQQLRQTPGGQALCKLFVLMGAQEDAAEGFLRRLIAWRNRLWPRLEVAVVDCGAGGDTSRIIRLLAGDLDYPVIEGGFCGSPGEQAAGVAVAVGGGGGEAFLYYDARRHKGKELIRAPLFFLLKEEVAGQ